MKYSKSFGIIIIILSLLIASCGQTGRKRVNQSDFPDKLYLKAKGLGQSEAEARNNAFSELSKIFEAKVSSNTKDIVSSVIKDNYETYTQSIKSDITIESSVKLSGARIKDEWYEDKTKTYYALSVLNKKTASNNWANEIDSIDEKISALTEGLNKKTSHLESFKIIKNVIKLWIKRETFSERIRVLGANYPKSLSYSIGNIFKSLGDVRKNLIINIDGKGDLFFNLKSTIQNSLTKKGLIFSNKKSASNVLIECTVNDEQLDVKNPGWVYSRVAVSIKVIDLESKVIVGEIVKDKRSAKTSYNEARKQALETIMPKINEELISFFE